ncbi:hypothetical protein [Niallia sp. FSL M8-0099]|uniref:hypothetical protein n=1 Tax=Niallia sp. FSL M8-0099 TaxID=2954519 RepID=UPI0030FBBFC4
MTFKGEIKYFAHISQEGAESFYKAMQEIIPRVGNHYAEIQYSTTMQPNGIALFSAIVIGREREGE